MRPLRVGIAALALMAVAGTLAAQSGQHVVTYTGHSGVKSTQSWGGYYYYVGPYHASVPGLPTLDIFCVDFFNGLVDAHPSTPGINWTANFTSIQDLSSGSGLSSTRLGQRGLADAVMRYKRSAWLATQFALHSGADNWTAIQSAIWQETAAGAGNPPNWTGSDGWLKALNSFDPEDVNWNYWYVVTDVRSNGITPGSQEYLTYVTPEPGTIILMVSGLVVLAGTAIVTRRVV